MKKIKGGEKGMKKKEKKEEGSEGRKCKMEGGERK